MQLLKASKKDISTIQQIAEVSWAEAYKEILSPDQISYMLENLYSTEVLADQMDGDHYQYFLIQTDGIKGFIGVEPHCEPQTTKLHRLYLLPQEKGKGLGKGAIDFVKRFAADVGDRRIILNVNKRNPAQKFYRSQGFTLCKDEVVDIGSGYVMDDFVMELTIS